VGCRQERLLACHRAGTLDPSVAEPEPCQTDRVRRLPAVLAVTAVLVAACSGGSKPAATAPTASPVTSTPSTPTSTSTSAAATPGTLPGTPAPALSWSGCGGGFQCSSLRVQLDPAKPGLGTVAIALTRHRATGHRIGSLLVNPGGPGASAVEFLKQTYTSFPSTLRQHFDLAAFDPRGVGLTAPVRCLSTSQLDAYFHLDPVPDSAAERAALTAGNKRFTDGCKARSARILPYVTTRIVAQDMDRVRAALGDQKLTYLGYSYGTAIGASYLDQFPTHVRAMVLDGALDPTSSWDQLLAGQSKGFDVALNAFLANCEKIDCPFRKSVSGDLGQAYDALAAKVEQHALPGDGKRTVGPDEFTLGVGAGLYSRGNGWPAIAQALADAEDGKGRYLLALSDSYLDRNADGYENVDEANFAVNCVDRPWPRTEAPYYALAAQVGKDYPRFGPAIALSGLGCATWPVPATGTPHAVSGAGSPPIVVIGTTRDPATPYVWAQSLAKQLARGVLITHEGDGHTVFRNGAPNCILRPVDDYFVSLKVPTPSVC
jgi:pimeloyl-ACP methyl ester carboxylesterase